MLRSPRVMLMKIRITAALVLFVLGCAAEGAGAPSVQIPAVSASSAPAASAPAASAPAIARERLAVTTFAGPHATLDAACEAAVQAAGRPKPSAPCVATTIAIAPPPPFSARILRAPDASDPRFAGSGTFLLALGNGGAWFVAPKPIDQINGGAGHMYLPEVTLREASGVALPRGGVLALIGLHDVTSSVCTGCTGPDHDKRTPVETRSLWMVCGLDRAGKPACTAPISTGEKASASLTGDTLSIHVPGAASKLYEVVF
ncbi:Hypothetical protein A7982_06314 [Minicystis rosea]|nr:Hypothetical protein A7982_06314 [Minicystis rosea]